MKKGSLGEAKKAIKAIKLSSVLCQISHRSLKGEIYTLTMN